MFIRKYNIKRVQISIYYLQANGIIEKDHKLLINALSKIINREFRNWIDNLLAVLWTDRSTVRRSTGYIPFYLLYGKEPILPIKLKVPTWRIFP
jgi:hypothetical protein